MDWSGLELGPLENVFLSHTEYYSEASRVFVQVGTLAGHCFVTRPAVPDDDTE